MKKVVKLPIVTAMILSTLVGCASVSQWQPTVNSPVGTKQSSLTQDLQECKVLASQAAGYTSEIVGDTLTAGAFSVSEGAIIGSMVGGAGGAGVLSPITAAAGSVVGFFYGAYDADKTYKRAFNSCLSQRGHYVLY